MLCAFTHGERPRTQVERWTPPSKPIPDSERRLAKFQPSFARPPFYLEEPKAPGQPAAKKEGRNRAPTWQSPHSSPFSPTSELDPNLQSRADAPYSQGPSSPPGSRSSFLSLAAVGPSLASMPLFNPNRLKIPKPNLETDSNGWRTNSSFGPGTPVASLPSTPRSVEPSSSTRSQPQLIPQAVQEKHSIPRFPKVPRRIQILKITKVGLFSCHRRC